MKKRRQEAILEIIEKYDLSTQDELLQKLKDSGFDATQATVSRDIKELRLVKTMGRTTLEVPQHIRPVRRLRRLCGQYNCYPLLYRHGSGGVRGV